MSGTDTTGRSCSQADRLTINGSNGYIVLYYLNVKPASSFCMMQAAALKRLKMPDSGISKIFLKKVA